MNNIELKSTTGISKKWFMYLCLPICVFIISTHLFVWIATDKMYEVSISTIPVLLIVALILWFFIFSKLMVEVKDGNIAYKYFPFHFKMQTISKDEIESIEIVKIHWFKDFLGLGIRYGPLGKGYITSSEYALKVLLKDKRRIYFSISEESQKGLVSLKDV